ncbi:stage III sporulation protein AF [Anaerosalibacter sp. Marseille-P3206]|uniref:stage III sporulation protein AF n=1 Tax=Anaerosalibacter sp. Marseille-P3206 TaxID=1871005 RepID=UPI000985F44E|nr:stage III sporulation protein AF [Anaerosalibacter sp. Marseille-P3206]
MVNSFLKEWLIQIVSTFIFVSLLEIVLPNGQMKKYIDMIIGLLIIIVIINPFIKFIFKDIDIERNIFTSSEKMVGEYQVDKEMLNLQQEQMKNAYVMKLQEDVKNLVEEKTDFMVLRTYVEIKDDIESEDFGTVEKVQLEIDKKNISSNKDNQVVNIEDVEVVNVKCGKSKSIKEDEFEKSSEIKKIISEKYSLSEDNILISLNRETEGE